MQHESSHEIGTLEADVRDFVSDSQGKGGLALPPDLALLIKAFIALEGLGRQFDSDFDMAGEATPFLEQVLLPHAAPGAVIRRGKLQVQVAVLPLKHFGDRLDRAASRLVISIFTAVLIVGSTIVMTVERAPALPGLPSFGLLGFIAAVIGGIWVLFSIWRGGKS
jgi:ubiquinone biosynthesis protein